MYTKLTGHCISPNFKNLYQGIFNENLELVPIKPQTQQEMEFEMLQSIYGDKGATIIQKIFS